MSKRLSIAHVIGSFEVGGAEQVTLDLASHQVEDGCLVHVLSLAMGEHGPNARRFANAGVRVHRIPKMGPSVDLSLPFRLGLFFRNHRIDVVHSHNPLPEVYCAAARALGGPPLVHTKHGANHTAGSQRLRQIARHAVSAFVAVSEETARDAYAQGEVPGGGIQVIENGIDLSVYGANAETRRQIRAELGIREDELVVGTVGRLSPVKNQTLLLKAFTPLLSRARLVIVGDGPSRQQVYGEIAKIEHEGRIHALGQRMDVPRLLTAFDVFALSSNSEGLPLVIPQAMVTGLPVVSTAVGGIPAVVSEGETGLLVPAGDVDAMTRAIGWMLDNAGASAEMGRRGREAASARYSSRVMHQRYLEVYERVTSMP